MTPRPSTAAASPILKLGRFEQAIADYDAALARNPRDPGSLYGRGLARLRGQNDSGRADLVAAKTLVEITQQHSLRNPEPQTRKRDGLRGTLSPIGGALRG
jgi:tetratricopeptide repeat protein